jgi:hypothetical protein
MNLHFLKKTLSNVRIKKLKINYFEIPLIDSRGSLKNAGRNDFKGTYGSISLFAVKHFQL